MEGSKLNYQTWAIAMYLFLTNLKSVSSMKFHRDLEVTQKVAYHETDLRDEEHLQVELDAAQAVQDPKIEYGQGLLPIGAAPALLEQIGLERWN